MYFQWLSHVWLFVTPWTVARQVSLSMGFSRQEYWSGLPFPSPGDHPDPGIKPGSAALQADSLPSEPQGSPYNVILFSNKKEIECWYGLHGWILKHFSKWKKPFTKDYRLYDFTYIKCPEQERLYRQKLYCIG